MTNAPEDFDLARELAATDDWDGADDGYPDLDSRRRHHRRDGPRRAPRPAPRRRAVHRARGHHRGRVPPAAARAGRPRRRVDPGRDVEDAENSMAELALLAETAGSQVLDALYQRRDSPDPATYIGRGKVEGLRRDRQGDRRRHGDPRRRARAQPAAQPRGQGQGQGRRPDRADPRHLRPAREEQGGPGAGRAGPAQLHEAAAARLGRQPVAPGRWPRRLAGRRHRWPRSR